MQNAKVGDVIGRVVAQSETETDLFTYSIVSSNGLVDQQYFSLDSENGDISVAQKLDYETMVNEFRVSSVFCLMRRLLRTFLTELNFLPTLN